MSIVLIILLLCIVYLYLPTVIVYYQIRKPNESIWELYLTEIKEVTDGDTSKEFFCDANEIIDILKNTSLIKKSIFMYYNNLYGIHISLNSIMIHDKYWYPSSPQQLATVYNAILNLDDKESSSHIIDERTFLKFMKNQNIEYLSPSIIRSLNRANYGSLILRPIINYVIDKDAKESKIDYEIGSTFFTIIASPDDYIIIDPIITIFIYSIYELIVHNVICINNGDTSKDLFCGYITSINTSVQKNLKLLDNVDVFNKYNQSYDDIPYGSYMCNIPCSDGFEHIDDYVISHLNIISPLCHDTP